jgi:hypothetical protein
MNLLVLPGGGNPDASPLYSEVYALISREAKKFGYNEVKTDIRWPGHVSIPQKYEQSDPLTLKGAVTVAIKAINALSDDVPFTILARSFGCLVALKLANQEDQSIRRAYKNILWGPAPYWLLWEMFVRDLKENKEISKNKGLKVDESSFTSLESIESLIINTSLRTIVASGNKDPLCTPAYIKYLSSITNENRLVTFTQPVVGAGHEVVDASGEQVVRKYVEALFGE